MNNRNYISLIALCISTLSFSQHDISSQKVNGVNWIFPNSPQNVFQVVPRTEIDQKKCAASFEAFNSMERMEYCREDHTDLMCPSFNVKEVGAAYSFGPRFGSSKNKDDIEVAATTTWEVTGSTNQALDPSLINEYAAQLGLDPRESAVAVVQPDGINLAKKDGEPQFSFRQPESTDHEGYSYSWLFQDGLEILQDRSIYINQAQQDRPYFTLTSYVLNCELSRGASDYLDIQADVKATGIRYYAPKVIDRAFKAYQDLASKNIPAGATKEDRSLLYGYYLARAFDAELVDTIGLKNLASMLFEERAGKIAIKPLADKAEFAEAISIVGTHVTQNQRVRLSMTP